MIGLKSYSDFYDKKGLLTIKLFVLLLLNTNVKREINQLQKQTKFVYNLVTHSGRGKCMIKH